MYLKNKPVCTIVGAGPGVGLSVAKRFAKGGFRIALIARRRDMLDEYKTELTRQGADVHVYHGDAGDFESLIQAFKNIQGTLGDTHVLVYNAAVKRSSLPSECSPARLLDDFKVNVGGALQSAQLVIPAMKEAKKGTILFTGGGLALEPLPLFASTAIGKAGIRSLAHTLFGEFLTQGIHIATVTICGIVTPGTKFDPDLIAEEYWKLHSQPQGKWEKERIIR
jgi:short-subunit dehydrogenase